MAGDILIHNIEVFRAQMLARLQMQRRNTQTAVTVALVVFQSGLDDGISRGSMHVQNREEQALHGPQEMIHQRTVAFVHGDVGGWRNFVLDGVGVAEVQVRVIRRSWTDGCGLVRGEGRNCGHAVSVIHGRHRDRDGRPPHARERGGAGSSPHAVTGLATVILLLDIIVVADLLSGKPRVLVLHVISAGSHAVGEAGMNAVESIVNDANAHIAVVKRVAGLHRVRALTV